MARNRWEVPLRTLEVAEAVAQRVHGRSAQVRRSFFDRSLLDVKFSDRTPLAHLLQEGGRAGEVRLKLLLSVLWIAARPPHDVTSPARTWAALIGLNDPSNAGSRRINDAMTWLENARLVRLTRRPGQATRITLLEETRSGEPYVLPGSRLHGLRDPEARRRHFYVQLPEQVWVNGWIAALSGAALGMFLILLGEAANAETSEAAVWFSPANADDRYGISASTRSRGVRELAQYDLVSIERKPLGADVLDTLRFRNTYRLHLPVLARQPAPPPFRRRAIDTPAAQAS